MDLLPALNSGRVELPPDDRLISQLIGLERRTARGWRDSIDHAPGVHDDRANVIAGLVSSKPTSSYDFELFMTGHRSGSARPKNTHTTRRPMIEVLRADGIPLINDGGLALFHTPFILGGFFRGYRLHPFSV
ncbi:hypothetical protein ACFL0N_01420 [Pseudomonadota bacterium]